MALTPTAAAQFRVVAGLPVDHTTLPRRARRALALADELGAPRGPVLAVIGEVERAARARHEELALALAGPRAVARGLVLAPPVVGPATALLVSDTPFAVWATTPGRFVAALAASLWLVGWVSVRLLVRRAVSVPSTGGPDRDEVLELLAVAVAAGCPLTAATRRVGSVLRTQDVAALGLWLQLGAVAAPPRGWEADGPTLAAAHQDGAPLVSVLRGLAAADRRERHHAAMGRIARLEPRLTLPTTLLLLPAAGLTVAAPLVHGLLVALA